MKIAIDCRLIGKSGIGTFIKNLVLHIVHTPNAQFLLIGDKQVLTPFNQLDNCKIVVCVHASFTIKELFNFPTHEVNQCDVFFTPNFNIPLGIKVPIFSTIHDVVFFDVKGICSPIGRLIRWLYIKRALNISKTVFTVSHFSEGRIRSLFHYNKEIIVVNNGISQELINYRQENAISKQKDDDYIVFLGNLKKHKGIIDLLEAYHIAKTNEGFKSKLYIIGRIDSRTIDKDLLQIIRHHDSQIQFITNADNHRVYELLLGAKALISPSHYEGFGIPPLEAMYLGTPAIISDIATHKEIYQSTPAVFFKTGNAEDLAKRLLELTDKSCNVDKIVDEQYNFKQTAEKVFNTIQINVR